ncbi:MAG: hypothetical protein KZQ73_03950 [Candidatus Thiodiazotropha sp. (ex Semelilucina semeliformis)]|nr:hypothetical protein [Candidatus Thiodiazotropha sp. (ex Semelilucina semeliformis)]
MSKPSDTINAVGHALTEQARGLRAFGLFFADLGFSLTMPLLRRNMGERYFSPFLIGVMSIFAITMSLVMKVNPTFISMYVGLIMLTSLYHLYVISKRNRRGEDWHSRGEGEFNIDVLVNRLPKGKDYWWKESFYEPLLVFVTGIIVGHFVDAGLGAVFLFSAPWMILRSQYQRLLIRSTILDARDLRIESEQKISALNGEPAEDTKGYVVKNVNNMRPNDREALAKRMLDEKDFSSLSTPS